MTITDLVLILFIAALLAYALYDQFIMPRRNGPTLLSIALLRRGRVDSVIFVGLVAILIPEKTMLIISRLCNKSLTRARPDTF